MTPTSLDISGKLESGIVSLLRDFAAVAGVTPWMLVGAENPVARTRDFQDIAHIIDEYINLGNWDRLEGADADLTARADFEMQSVGAEMLGRDVAKIKSPMTRETLLQILTEQVNMGEMAPTAQIVANSLTGRSYAASANLIERLMRGIKSSVVL